MFSRTLYQLVTKFLIAAVLLQSITPALAAGMAPSPASHEGWAEICTVLGTKWVKQNVDKSFDKRGEKLPLDQHSGSDHCIFCMSTGALDAFDASNLKDEVRASSIFTYADTLAARAFSGHSILSRAPPQ